MFQQALIWKISAPIILRVRASNRGPRVSDSPGEVAEGRTNAQPESLRGAQLSMRRVVVDDAPECLAAQIFVPGQACSNKASSWLGFDRGIGRPPAAGHFHGDEPQSVGSGLATTGDPSSQRTRGRRHDQLRRRRYDPSRPGLSSRDYRYREDRRRLRPLRLRARPSSPWIFMVPRGSISRRVRMARSSGRFRWSEPEMRASRSRPRT